VTFGSAILAAIIIIVVAAVLMRGPASAKSQKIDHFGAGALYTLMGVILVSGFLGAHTIASDRLHANAAYIKAEYGVTLAPEDAAPNAANPASGRDADGKKHAYILKYEDGGIVLYTAELHRVPQVTR
jgi:hypothetical protein